MRPKYGPVSFDIIDAVNARLAAASSTSNQDLPAMFNGANGNRKEQVEFKCSSTSSPTKETQKFGLQVESGKLTDFRASAPPEAQAGPMVSGEMKPKVFNGGGTLPRAATAAGPIAEKQGGNAAVIAGTKSITVIVVCMGD